MTPLWTTRRTPSPPTCGWALTSVAGAVRGPAGVADADVCRGAGCDSQLRGQVVDAAGRLGDVQARRPSIVATPALS